MVYSPTPQLHLPRVLDGVLTQAVLTKLVGRWNDHDQVTAARSWKFRRRRLFSLQTFFVILLCCFLVLRNAASTTFARSDVQFEEEVPQPVDFIIDGSWIQTHHARFHELVWPSDHDGVTNAGYVSRVIVPRRLEDVDLLRLLAADQLRVELFPHRSRNPEVLVRILTNGLQLASPTHVRRKRWSMFSQGPGKWLVFLELAIQYPSKVMISRCSSTWHWAGLNETGLFSKRTVKMPIRALKVTCPCFARGFGFLAPAWPPAATHHPWLAWVSRPGHLLAICLFSSCLRHAIMAGRV
jgi:hypothetical protein